eukprot:jgi/Chlat1/7472/Chrsp6S09193
MSLLDDGYMDSDSDNQQYDYGDAHYLGEEEDPPLNARAPACDHDWKVIDAKCVKDAQARDLATIMELMSLNPYQARALLIHFRWNVESLLGAMAEKGQEQLFRDAGVPSRVHAFEQGSHMEVVDCPGCLESVHRELTTTMDCGHTACNPCWTQHFLIKIKDGQSKRCLCMAFKCGLVCNEEKVHALVSAVDVKAAAKYNRALVESYIEDNARVKWCPSTPHCGNAIRVDGEPYLEPLCSCSHRFCFNCGSVPHSPCSCEMWRLWEVKCRDESETYHWLTANTKPCPKCTKPVEKSGGCNLVACMCGQAFCWLCGTATGREHTWTSIAGHSCGRFKEEKEKAAAQASRDLQRYLHYHSRWKAHMDSQKLEQKQKENTEAKIARLEESDSTVRGYSWLTNGLLQLFQCRRVLAYSYCFAYYMFGSELFADEITEQQNSINQNLFEDHQEQLAETVERLSKTLETPIDCIDEEVRMQVVNLTGLADTRCCRMYDIVENELLGVLQLHTHHIAPYRSQNIVIRTASTPSPSPRTAQPTPVQEASTSSLRADSRGPSSPQPSLHKPGTVSRFEGVEVGADYLGDPDVRLLPDRSSKRPMTDPGDDEASSSQQDLKRSRLQSQSTDQPAPLHMNGEDFQTTSLAGPYAQHGLPDSDARQQSTSPSHVAVQTERRAERAYSQWRSRRRDEVRRDDAPRLEALEDGSGVQPAPAPKVVGGLAPVCPVCAVAFEHGASNDDINAHVDQLRQWPPHKPCLRGTRTGVSAVMQPLPNRQTLLPRARTSFIAPLATTGTLTCDVVLVQLPQRPLHAAIKVH